MYWIGIYVYSFNHHQKTLIYKSIFNQYINQKKKNKKGRKKKQHRTMN